MSFAEPRSPKEGLGLQRDIKRDGVSPGKVIPGHGAVGLGVSSSALTRGEHGHRTPRMLKPQGTAPGLAFPQEGQGGTHSNSFPWGHRSTKQLGKATGCGYGARHCLVLVPREEIQGLTRQKQLTKTRGRGAAKGQLFFFALQGWAGSARRCPLGARLLPPCEENPLRAFSSPLHQQQDEQLAHGRWKELPQGSNSPARGAVVCGVFGSRAGGSSTGTDSHGDSSCIRTSRILSPALREMKTRGEGAEPFPRSPGEFCSPKRLLAWICNGLR